MSKKEKKLDEYDRALVAVTAPYVFVYDRLLTQKEMFPKGNTCVVTIPVMNPYAIQSLIECFIISSQHFNHASWKDSYSDYDDSLLGHTITFWKE